MHGLEGISSHKQFNRIALAAALKIGGQDRFLSRQIPEVIQ